MTALADAKAKHIKQADDRWEDAVQGVRRFLTYDRRSHYGDNDYFNTPEAIREDAKVREVTRLLMTANGQTLFHLLGGLSQGFGIKMDSYSSYWTEDPCGLMEFIRFFVGHELLDDGDPGIGYYRSTRGGAETFVLCGPDDEGAQPYFHRSVEFLRKDYPDAKLLCVDDTIRILKDAEQKRRNMATRFRKHIAKHGEDSFWDEEDARAYDISENQKMRAALVDEIIAMDA